MSQRIRFALLAKPSLAVMAIFFVSATTAWAQTPPTPTTIFNQSIDTSWINASNWNSGVPTASSDAKIADGKTAFFDQTGAGEPLFGTLTLGVNSTFQLKAGSNEGIPTNQDVYFSNGSALQFTAGSSNRDSDFFVLSGANATWTTSTNTIYRGTLNGAGNFTVIMGGTVESRVEASGFTGHLTYQSNNGSIREVSNLGQFGGTTSVGSGGATFANKVFVTQAQGNRMHDSATVILSGAGGASYKWKTPGSEQITNLIIESPSQSGPFLITGNGTNSSTVRVTDTATFQGTAGTVEIQSQMSGSFGAPLKARDSGVDINANKFVFQGTGNWTINGSKVTTGTLVDPANYAIGSIGVVGGGDVTTHANVTVNAAFDAPSGFTKKGAGTLTLNYVDPVRTVQSGTQNFNPKGNVNVNEGTLKVNVAYTAPGTYTVASGATLGGIGSVAASVNVQAGGHLAPGNSIGTMGSGPLTIAGIYDVELGTPGASHASPGLSDLTNVSGNLNYGGATLNLINNAGADGNGSVGAGSYKIFTYTGTNGGAFGSTTGPGGGLLPQVVDDTVGNVYLDLLDPASASFTSPGSSTFLNLDIGTFPQNSGLHSANFEIYNLLQTLGFTANLDLDSFSVSGPDDPNLSADLALFVNNLTPGNSRTIPAILSTANIGTFTETYVLQLSSSGFLDPSQTLTLNISGAVEAVPEPASVAVWGIVTLALAGFGYQRIRRKR